MHSATPRSTRPRLRPTGANAFVPLIGDGAPESIPAARPEAVAETGRVPTSGFLAGFLTGGIVGIILTMLALAY